jgi:homeobox-leucine zipper protein
VHIARTSSLLCLQIFVFAEGFAAGCNNGNGNANVRMDLDMNQPAGGGEEEELPMGSVEEDEEERGGGGPHHPKKLRLSKESRLLEESFRLNHTLTPVSKLKPAF